MVSGFDAEKRFNADPAEIEAISKNKIRQIIGIIIGIVALIFAFYFRSLQENTYNLSHKDIYNILKISMIAIGLLELTLSPIVLYDLSRIEKNLTQTHITVYDDGIEGVCFGNPSIDSIGIPFKVSYANVVEALAVSSVSAKGLNLRIITTATTYSCYAIEQSKNVAKLINEKVAEYAKKSDSESRTLSFEPSKDIFCVYCGMKLPNDAAFCTRCGKEIREIGKEREEYV